MVRKNITSLMFMTFMIATIFPSTVWAIPNEKVSSEESNAKDKAEEISTEINLLVSTINSKYQKIAELEEEINGSEKEIKTTRASIEETEKNILKRMDTVGQQLQSMQLNSVSETPFLNLISADSFNEFFNRMYAISVLGSAQREKIDTLSEDQETLTNLEQVLLKTKQELEDKKTAAKSEEDGLDEQLSGLQKKLAANNSLLQEFALERVEKENSKREAALKAAQAKSSEKSNGKTTKETSKDTGKDTSKTNDDESSEKPLPTPTPLPEEKPSKPAGNTMSGQATAYVATGNLTATGTVPGVHRTIAVDPSVIPLGSSVKITVPGAPAYSGVYIAEDTGGVVHGNIIDIFVGSEGEAKKFGRQSITFQIL